MGNNRSDKKEQVIWEFKRLERKWNYFRVNVAWRRRRKKLSEGPEEKGMSEHAISSSRWFISFDAAGHGGPPYGSTSRRNLPPTFSFSLMEPEWKNLINWSLRWPRIGQKKAARPPRIRESWSGWQFEMIIMERSHVSPPLPAVFHCGWGNRTHPSHHLLRRIITISFVACF